MGLVGVEFIEEVGTGANADVWKARDPKLERIVAVKLFRTTGSTASMALEQARALCRVSSPYVVTVHEVTSAIHPVTGQELPAVVMEFVAGLTLAARLESGRVTLSEARRIGCGLLEGLARVHKAGIVHGDLHDENVLVVSSGVKLIDLVSLRTSRVSPDPANDLAAAGTLLLRLLAASVGRDPLKGKDTLSTDDYSTAAEMLGGFESLLEAFATSTQPRLSPVAGPAADPLFDIYRPCHEPFYLERAFDRELSGFDPTRGLWLYGESGIGKSSALRRLLRKTSGFRYVCMAAYVGLDGTEALRQLADEVGHRLPDGSGTRRLASEALSDALARSLPTGGTLYLDELPFEEGSDFSSFVAGLVSATLHHSRMHPERAARLVVSSIRTPGDSIPGAHSQIGERLQIVQVPSWTFEERLGLTRLIHAELPLLSDGQIRELVERLECPRHVKHAFRVIRSKRETPSLDHVVAQVHADLEFGR